MKRNISRKQPLSFFCLILILFAIIFFNKQDSVQNLSNTSNLDVSPNAGESFFSSFTPSLTNLSQPNCSIEFNMSPNIIENFTEGFYYSRNDLVETGFINVHQDLFENNQIAGFWSYLNKPNGTFIEQNGSIQINDTGYHQWGGEPGFSPKYDAPAITQEIWGDLELSIILDTSTFDADGEDGGLLYLAGDDIIKFFYHSSGTNSSGKLEIIRTQMEENILLARKNVTSGQEINLTIKREDNLFSFLFSIAGNESELIKNTKMNLFKEATVGIYAAANASIKVLAWFISPRVELEWSDNYTGRIHAINVPFNQYDDDNNIQFKINGSSNEFNSIYYNVTIDCSEGTIPFDYINPEESDDTTPDIRFYMPSNVTGYNFDYFKEGSCSFAYSKNGKKPDKFINPHNDNFIFNSSTSNNSLPSYWKLTNPNNLNHSVNDSETILHLQDVNNSVWNETVRNSPFLTQNMHGDFTVISKLVYPQGSNISGGLILVFNENFTINFETRRFGVDDINLSIVKIESGSYEILGSVIIDELTDGALWLKIKYEDQDFEFSYSVTGGSYNIYLPLGIERIQYSEIFEVGLIVKENSSLYVDYWDITPNILLKAQIDVEYRFYIHVQNVPFNQYGSEYNGIQVSIRRSTNEPSYSNVFYINIFPETFNGYNVLHHDESHVNLITYSKELNRSIYSPNALDMEYLEMGNILVTSGLPGSGAITEYDTQGNVTWQVTDAGVPLNWPHDADRLPNGNTLIADTGNDRAIEINPGGSIVWQWDPWDDFNIMDADGGTSHLNDVDRLPNGNTLICLRNLYAVVEVSPSGSIVWSYGGPGSGLLGHPHNPDRLSNGNTMICDSGSQRVIEVTPQGGIAWEFKPMVDGNPFLGWPRDADLLPNNHLLVSDTRVNTTGQDAIYEIDRETGQVLWTLETSSANYEADVVYLHQPMAGILLPHNTTYYSRKIDLVLNKTSLFDDAYYMIHDDTSGRWLNDQPEKYNGRAELVLENDRIYTITAWANNSGGFGGGYPQDDSIQLPSAGVVNVTFTVNLSANISEGEPYPGTVILVSDYPPTIYEVDNLNQTIWSYEIPIDEKDHVIATGIMSVDMMPNGHLLLCLSYLYDNSTGLGKVLEMDYNGNIFWEYREILPFTDAAYIHDADYIPETDTFLIADTLEETVIEVDRNGSILWEWDPEDYFAYPSGTEEHYYHLNDADRLPNGNTLLSLLLLNLVLEVNPVGDIIWSIGDPVMSNSTIRTQHNPTRLSNNNTIICDSGNDRVIEVDMAGNVVWNTEDFSNLSLFFPRGAERLPNGNTLISDSLHNRHIEIDRNGTIVWEFTGANLAYDADKVYRYPPYLELKPIVDPTNVEGGISIQILSEAMDLDATWFNIYDEVNEEWMFDDMFVMSGEIINVVLLAWNTNLGKTIHLEEGNYSIHAWCKGTNMNSVLMTSDHNVKIAHVVIGFTLSPGDLTSPYILIGIILASSTAGIVFLVYAKKNPKVVMFFKGIKDKFNRDECEENEKHDSLPSDDDYEDLKLDFV